MKQTMIAKNTAPSTKAAATISVTTDVLEIKISTQGGTLVETTTMPETSFTITQGTLTITEYGNSVPYTGKLDDLSEHPIREIVHKVLKNDARKAFDIDAHAQFDTIAAGGSCPSDGAIDAGFAAFLPKP
ncbi:hypothetical protein IH922_10055 [candidate division KSB1 bacterium]|nr:hypothetical protein [candidate division KSB1 bacterium]